MSPGTSAPGILYVHADHLGNPQKMTDSTQAVVWDAVYTPFGQVHSITGTATNHQRFPGQYFDQETGYHQNWFRDYDPSTGRYIQSDSIGLVGGMNTYAYAQGTPIKNIDPKGLFSFSGYIGCAKGYANQANRNLSNDGEKHCWVSCKIASTCGLGTWGSAVAGVAKEIRDLFDFDSGTHAEFRDLLNDAKGNLCASSGTSQCQGCGQPLNVRPGQCDICCGCLANQGKLS